MGLAGPLASLLGFGVIWGFASAPADMLGALLGARLLARVDGALSQSDSDTVGDEAVDPLLEEVMDACLI